MASDHEVIPSQERVETVGDDAICKKSIHAQDRNSLHILSLPTIICIGIRRSHPSVWGATEPDARNV